MALFIPETPRRSNPYLDRIRAVQGSIVEQDVDAIVTVIPQSLEYRGSINQLIEKTAGEKMDVFLRENIVQPRLGDIYAVPGFNLPCDHIFFCVAPVWRDEWDRHDQQILNAARKGMELARSMSLKTVAFPPIGSGRNGFPKPRVSRLIVQGVLDRLDRHFDEVRLVCQTPETHKLFEERLKLARL